MALKAANTSIQQGLSQLMSIYNKPPLTGQTALYKGRRYWAFLLDKELTYGGRAYKPYGDPKRTVALFDCLEYAVILEGELQDDGSISGFIPYGQDSIPCRGNNAKEFVANSAWEIDWINKEAYSAVRKEIAEEMKQKHISHIAGYELKLWKKLGFRFSFYRQIDGEPFGFSAQRKIGDKVFRLDSRKGNYCLALITDSKRKSKENHLLAEDDVIKWFASKSHELAGLLRAENN